MVRPFVLQVKSQNNGVGLRECIQSLFETFIGPSSTMSSAPDYPQK